MTLTASRRRALAIVLSLVVLAGFSWLAPDRSGTGASEPLAQAPADAPLAVLTLATGEVVIRLRPDLAPNHVQRITTLANEGFYDGVVFHRVIPGFMAQTGDPSGTGMGGSSLPNLAGEFSPTADFTRGTVGMARSADRNSANSQFFIVTGPAPHLNGDYTLLGEVVSGMEHVESIAAGDPRANGAVENPDAIVTLRVRAP